MTYDLVQDRINLLKQSREQLLDQVIQDLRKEYNLLQEVRSFTEKIKVELEKDFQMSWKEDTSSTISYQDITNARNVLISKLDLELEKLYRNQNRVEFNLEIKTFCDKCNSYARLFEMDQGLFFSKIMHVM